MEKGWTHSWEGPAAGGRGLLPLDATSYLHWTRELHHYKGNVLFGDGHVEELNRALIVTSLEPTASARLTLPDLPSASVGTVQQDTAIGGSPTMPASNTTSPWATLGTSAPPAGSTSRVPSASGHSPAGFHVSIRPASEASSPSNQARPTVTATNRPGRVIANRPGGDVTMSTFDLQLVAFLQDMIKWTYLLLLLLLLLYLAFRLWQRERRRLKQQRTRRLNG